MGIDHRTARPRRMTALAALGIIRDEVAQPLQPLSAAEREHIAKILFELGFEPALASQQA